MLCGDIMLALQVRPWPSAPSILSCQVLFAWHASAVLHACCMRQSLPVHCHLLARKIMLEPPVSLLSPPAGRRLAAHAGCDGPVRGRSVCRHQPAAAAHLCGCGAAGGGERAGAALAGRQVRAQHHAAGAARLARGWAWCAWGMLQHGVRLPLWLLLVACVSMSACPQHAITFLPHPLHPFSFSLQGMNVPSIAMGITQVIARAALLRPMQCQLLGANAAARCYAARCF